MSPDDASMVSTARPGPARLWLTALSAALLAGLASWLLGEASQEWFAVRTVRSPGPPSLEEQVVIRSEHETSALRTAALANAWLGGALGLALGAAGGLERRAASRVAGRLGVVGLVAGAVAGAAAALAAMPVCFVLLDRDPMARESLVSPLLVHVLLWGPVGAAAGWAFGLSSGDRHVMIRAAVGGLLGAVVGAVVFEIVGALAFPVAMTFRPIAASWEPRLLARLLIALPAAAGVVATLAPVAAIDAGPEGARRRPVG